MARFDRMASVEVGLRNDTFNGYIGTIKLSALRISFSIQKNLAWSTNTASVKIWAWFKMWQNWVTKGDQIPAHI